MTSAFLGISIGSPYYSADRIHAYLLLAKLRFVRFAFLLGDKISRYSIAATKGMSLPVANQRTQKTTLSLEKMLKRTSEDIGMSVEIYRWKRVQSIPGYGRILAAVKEEFNTNPVFRACVREQVWINLGSRIAASGVFRDAKVTNRAAKLCDRYIVTEVAGLITMSELTPYELEIYPGEDLKIMEVIYKDEFPIIAKALPKIRKRRFECLRVNVD